MNAQYLPDRRKTLSLLAGLGATTALPAPDSAAQQQKTTGMGLVIYDCNIRRRWMQQRDPNFDLFVPLNFLKHCHELGAGGMQARLGILNPPQVDELRNFARQHGMFIEASVSPPQDETDVARFAAELQTAAAVGATAARTVIIPGRRYERFLSLEEFRKFENRGRRMLELAAPIAERHQVPLAVENHKDQRLDERIALFEHIGSEFVGACVDTGNSFALLDDPYETIEALAPYAFAVHLKDQALREYEEGFLLGDIPLGQGSFDLPRMVDTLRRAKPQIRFALELITRDALRVPCLTSQYWATLPNVPGSALAHAIVFVRRHETKQVQEVSKLDLEEQVQLENANVAASINYARDRLNL